MLFEELQKSNLRITKGLCAAFLSRSAEAKCLHFADEFVKYATNSGITIAMCRALLKVYAYCDMYERMPRMRLSIC